MERTRQTAPNAGAPGRGLFAFLGRPAHGTGAGLLRGGTAERVEPCGAEGSPANGNRPSCDAAGGPRGSGAGWPPGRSGGAPIRDSLGQPPAGPAGAESRGLEHWLGRGWGGSSWTPVYTCIHVFPGEISITSDMQMTPPLWQKVKN